MQSPGSHANNIHWPGSDKLTEVQLYMSTSCQPGSPVIRVFSDVEKCFFLFSDLAVKPPDQKIKLFNVREGSDQQPCKLVLLTRSPGG